MTPEDLNLAVEAYEEREKHYWNNLCQMITGKPAYSKKVTDPNIINKMLGHPKC